MRNKNGLRCYLISIEKSDNFKRLDEWENYGFVSNLNGKKLNLSLNKFCQSQAQWNRIFPYMIYLQLRVNNTFVLLSSCSNNSLSRCLYSWRDTWEFFSELKDNLTLTSPLFFVLFFFSKFSQNVCPEAGITWLKTKKLYKWKFAFQAVGSEPNAYIAYSPSKEYWLFRPIRCRAFLSTQWLLFL